MVNLKAVGDITLVTKSNISPFEKVKKAFRNKDIVFGNLETVLSTQGKKVEKSILLCNNPAKVKFLKDAGFDILNLANNHIGDMGLDGFNETLDMLHKNNMSFFGVSNSKYPESHIVIEKEGIRLGFLGYCDYGFKHIKRRYTINKINKLGIIKDIINLKAYCDIIIVSLHWGVESVFFPSPGQIELARKLIDTGAILVLGHGPRVIQGIERYKHGLIAYSLGNFQFDFDHEIIITNKLSEALILSLNISRDRIESYEIVPVNIDREYVPYIVEGEEKEERLDFISEISKKVSQGQVTTKWWFEQIASTYLVTNIYSWLVRIEKYGFRHAIQCIKWLVSPFVIRCYMGLLRNAWKKKLE